jgi:hypothetical protein
LLLKWRGLALRKSKAALDNGKANAMMRDRRNDMSNAKLPEGKSKTATRKRAMTNDGTVWTTWHCVTDDGILVIDRQWHGQYKKGEWRFILEKETKVITYEEA